MRYRWVCRWSSWQCRAGLRRTTSRTPGSGFSSPARACDARRRTHLPSACDTRVTFAAVRAGIARYQRQTYGAHHGGGLELRAVNVVAVVASALDTVRPTATTRGVQLSPRPPDAALPGQRRARRHRRGDRSRRARRHHRRRRSRHARAAPLAVRTGRQHRRGRELGRGRLRGPVRTSTRPAGERHRDARRHRLRSHPTGADPAQGSRRGRPRRSRSPRTRDPRTPPRRSRRASTTTSPSPRRREICCRSPPGSPAARAERPRVVEPPPG